jgi:hypothetical protein
LIGWHIYLFCAIFLEIMPKRVTQTQIHLDIKAAWAFPLRSGAPLDLNPEIA